MWEVKDNSLYRRFQFRDFIDAFTFMTSVAFQAEQMGHHPLWTNQYNVVEIWLTTHDEGDIVTEKDRKLSEVIDKVYQALKVS
ncbi:MAG: 4a-hydroxytetrahydrobiopterin dehydratase [Chitinophagaceae bacterium]|nr:4a-hydroxytetrahydrobiopterin dehydratase [Chitinophagaceae bacterium]